ncbi:MAG: GDP-mannose 4,6-dehydratase [Gammaproteobacteria bacterium]|jgi:UDP-glucuronate 4-epimerase
MKILVTGCAGFIGAACSKKLLERGDEVIGIDNLNDYYDPAFKQARLQNLHQYKNFVFHQIDITDLKALQKILQETKPRCILHLAAQVGVRFSIKNPLQYIQDNIVGFTNLLNEAQKLDSLENLVFASSSSVYGANTKMPYEVSDFVDHPISIYAASKKCDELIAHVYAHMYEMPLTGLRYFTVYGPWGRPDMAPIKFAKKIMADEPIPVFNYGNHSRDFTYIDDIVEGTILTLDNPKPYKVYNIGFGNPMQLMDFIKLLEKALGKKAIIDMQPKQPGDVDNTWADVSGLKNDFGYQPKIALDEGIARFAKWFLEY